MQVILLRVTHLSTGRIHITGEVRKMSEDGALEKGNRCGKDPGWRGSRPGESASAGQARRTKCCCSRGHTARRPNRIDARNGGEGWDHEAYEDSPTFTRPAFPLPTAPGWNEDHFGFFPGLRTPRSPMTHAKAGTVLLTLNRITPHHSLDPPHGVTTHYVRLSTSHDPLPRNQVPRGLRPRRDVH